MVVEKKFVKDKVREATVMEYLSSTLDRFGFSHVELQKTPVGFSILIHSSKPGLIVGRRGVNLNEIQETLQKKFGMESPMVEVREVLEPEINAQIMAERIGSQITRFGVRRFKAIGHKALESILRAGAIGAEIKIAGKVPSTRARSWKFYGGYLPKCGDVAIKEVKKGYKSIKLKSGVVGISVKILPPGIRMPDQVYLNAEPINVVEEAEASTEPEKEEKIKVEKTDSGKNKEKTTIKEKKEKEKKIKSDESKTKKVKETKKPETQEKENE